MPTATGRPKDGCASRQDPYRYPQIIEFDNGTVHRTRPMPDGKGYLVYDEDGVLVAEHVRIPRGGEE